MKIKPLPPMNSLIVFEAAARHLSFTRAANELNVTQGAISRQIRQLEEYLGKELFVRANRNIYLTPTGLQYYQTVYSALLEVAKATGEIKKWQGEHQVTVATSNAMAALWLLPKVTAFQQQEGIDLRILATDNIFDLHKMDCDIALFYCRVPPVGMNVTTLFPEEVFPVCSPSYLAQFAENVTAEELFGRTLLYLDDSQKDWITWSEWFESVNYPEVKPKNRVNINNYPMLLQAAMNGQGVALAWGSLVDEYLDNGTLVRPVETVLRTQANFCMLEPSDRGVIPSSVKQFRTWLLDQLPGQVGQKGLG
ncbi:MAG: LysR substrate-binding domain-containing protein [Proteobacteria bacterium]|jgi:LysR family transcriptional regulator, glycine cleavage system transcriptional activator|uniref:LysR substrate-binding domain-containing protein n=1 Tax=Acinetobacter venetianus TaxID=52133 RepID=UPI0007759B40|nr:LysR substrate-binding domain-containing protein [Acinetobacter venetianus]MDA0696262.1 LysR substrate-binding domain-containing protein [Pseudomonadota bacterium]KXO76852.1 LysR family transcriptional regulator [Acinetobacter venetianus]KXZ62395.1 Glycine cleavage system transcriptional activator [Acinetobacter venetianus]MCR4530335.1 LysR substrate-binding domain-containing protein [Acinetobacter venetianus]MDA1254368.1 LysR substrate-binding domain-containing protein [Pseudomonadota bact